MWLSLPVANCSTGISQVTKRGVPRVTDEYYEDSMKYLKEVGEQCEELIGGESDVGPHMSTATTARDMLSIVNAYADTEDGKAAAKPADLLNYYGISYGTFLGQTFASMFPGSVGNVVLDGVVSPEGFLANFTSNSVKHLDGVIAAFFIYCHEAGPSECAYYTGSTPKDIYDRFNQSFVQLDARKADAAGWSNATELEAALVALKVGLLTVADAPLSYFTSLPQILLDLETAIAAQNITSWVQETQAIYGMGGYDMPEWNSGVMCSDQNNRWYNKTLEDLRPLIEETSERSIAGEIWLHSMLGCTGWSIKAAEIFDGPFGGDTATPILFVANTYDSVSPIEK